MTGTPDEFELDLGEVWPIPRFLRAKPAAPPASSDPAASDAPADARDAGVAPPPTPPGPISPPAGLVAFALRRRQQRRLIRRLVLGLVLGLAVLIAAPLALWWWLSQPPDAPHSPHATVALPNSPLVLPDALSVEDTLPTAIEHVSADEAVKINAEIPFAHVALVPAPALRLPTRDNQTWLAAVDCLTAAVYYEAATEPLEGQRAVAQVVLNRVRHPAYPASVCGVVFQGAERTTGCQFSFACDGSLARVPGRAAWEASRQVAVRALAGGTVPEVGLATHYHADYVVPVWARRFVKLVKIGRHIFYRWPGPAGAPAAYAQTWAGHETRPFTALPGGGFVLGSDPGLGALASGSAEPAAPNFARTVLPAAPRTGTDGAGPAASPSNDRPTDKSGAGTTPAPAPAIGGERWIIGAQPGH